ncbi:MAG: hypothetical protein R6U98_10620, partial [Pirellulaceae bacterium]
RRRDGEAVAGCNTPHGRCVRGRQAALWDADWLVNLPDACPRAEPPRLHRLIGRVFRTVTGQSVARSLYGETL